MNLEFDSAIRQWLVDEAPAEAPDWLLHAVFERTAAQPHRARRWLPINRRARAVAIGSAAIAVIGLAFAAGIGYAQWSRIGTPPAPSPFSIPSRPADLPRDGTCELDRQCLGLLGPGTHGSEYFDPPVTFRVDEDGWENLRSSGGVVNLLPLDAPGDELLLLQDATPRSAGNRLVTGIGRTADEFVGWITSRSDLTVSDPRPITLGGLGGWEMDVAVRDDAPTGIRGCPTRPCVVIAFGADQSEMPSWAWDLSVWRGSTLRLFVLDHGSSAALVAVRAWDGSGLEALMSRVQPIVDSLRFDLSGT